MRHNLKSDVNFDESVSGSEADSSHTRTRTHTHTNKRKTSTNSKRKGTIRLAMPTVLAASCTSDTHRKSNTYNRHATAGSRDSSTKNINKLTRAAVQVQVASAHRREKHDKASNQQMEQQYVREVVIVTITTRTQTEIYVCVYIYTHTRGHVTHLCHSVHEVAFPNHHRHYRHLPFVNLVVCLSASSRSCSSSSYRRRLPFSSPSSRFNEHPTPPRL